MKSVCEKIIEHRGRKIIGYVMFGDGSLRLVVMVMATVRGCVLNTKTTDSPECKVGLTEVVEYREKVRKRVS